MVLGRDVNSDQDRQVYMLIVFILVSMLFLGMGGGASQPSPCLRVKKSAARHLIHARISHFCSFKKMVPAIK